MNLFVTILAAAALSVLVKAAPAVPSSGAGYQYGSIGVLTHLTASKWYVAAVNDRAFSKYEAKYRCSITQPSDLPRLFKYLQNHKGFGWEQIDDQTLGLNCINCGEKKLKALIDDKVSTAFECVLNSIPEDTGSSPDKFVGPVGGPWVITNGRAENWFLYAEEHGGNFGWPGAQYKCTRRPGQNLNELWRLLWDYGNWRFEQMRDNIIGANCNGCTPLYMQNMVNKQFNKYVNCAYTGQASNRYTGEVGAIDVVTNKRSDWNLYNENTVGNFGWDGAKYKCTLKHQTADLGYLFDALKGYTNWRFQQMSPSIAGANCPGCSMQHLANFVQTKMSADFDCKEISDSSQITAGTQQLAKRANQDLQKSLDQRVGFHAGGQEVLINTHARFLNVYSDPKDATYFTRYEYHCTRRHDNPKGTLKKLFYKLQTERPDLRYYQSTANSLSVSCPSCSDDQVRGFVQTYFTKYYDCMNTSGRIKPSRTDFANFQKKFTGRVGGLEVLTNKHAATWYLYRAPKGKFGWGGAEYKCKINIPEYLHYDLKYLGDWKDGWQFEQLDENHIGGNCINCSEQTLGWLLNNKIVSLECKYLI